MTHTKVVLIPAPMFVGAGLKGTDRFPQALVDAGLSDHLGAEQAAGPGPMTWSRDFDAIAEQPPLDAIRDYLLRLADDVEWTLQAGAMPMVMGGDCTVLLGAGVACKRNGIDGLLFVDGHTDFWPLGDPDWETASCDLALATGHGPKQLSHLAGEPSFECANVVALGFRDRSDEGEHGKSIVATDILRLPLSKIRSRGFGNAVKMALNRVAKHGRRFWLHLDVDVFDDAVLPAVDYRMPGGLSAGEVAAIIRRANETRALAGMTVSILNPDLDHEGSQVALVAGVLGTALRPT